MKLNKILLVGVMSLGVISVAHANSGTINFHGQVVDTPCSIDPGNGGAPDVPFGTVALNALTPGATAATRTFSINLVGCNTTTQKTAEIMFSGTAGHGDTFGVTGTATNIGILISGNAGVIKPGGIDTRTLVDGNHPLTYTAAVAADSTVANKVTPGNFTAVANYTITYK